MQLAVVVVIALYFAPSIVAYARGHANKGAILALNLLLGWTGLGWIAALIWSFTANVRRPFRLVTELPRDGFGRWVDPRGRGRWGR